MKKHLIFTSILVSSVCASSSTHITPAENITEKVISVDAATKKEAFAATPSFFGHYINKENTLLTGAFLATIFIGNNNYPLLLQWAHTGAALWWSKEMLTDLGHRYIDIKKVGVDYYERLKKDDHHNELNEFELFFWSSIQALSRAPVICWRELIACAIATAFSTNASYFRDIRHQNGLKNSYGSHYTHSYQQ